MKNPKAKLRAAKTVPAGNTTWPHFERIDQAALEAGPVNRFRWWLHESDDRFVCLAMIYGLVLFLIGFGIGAWAAVLKF